MRALVLGSAAGGGFPQWNCQCPNCAGLRRGEIVAKARTQSSVAITVNDKDWLLLNASPDIRTQLASYPELWPGDSTRRRNPVRGVVLVDGQIDHTAGLIILREGDPLDIYCTDGVHAVLSGPNPIFKVLEPFCGARFHPIPTNGDSFAVDGVEGIRITAIPLAGRPPRFASSLGANEVYSVALAITETETNKTLLYAPALAALDGAISYWLERCDVAMLDGSFWSGDELPRLKCGTKRAKDMGHLSLGDPGGLIELLRGFPKPRKVLVHINNTNPILNAESAEHARLVKEKIEVSYDGMRINI